MNFHGTTESRTITTGDGAAHRQHRFYCAVHGWFDLFVFPEAFIDHAACGTDIEPAAKGLELPKVLKKAA